MKKFFTFMTAVAAVAAIAVSCNKDGDKIIL